MTAPAALRPARAMYRGYFSNDRKRSALVKRLHVIRDTPVRGRTDQFPTTWCGQSAGPHRDSEPVILSPMPLVLPAGLGWCPKCIGHLAEYYGLLGEIAASLAAYDPGLSSGETRRAYADEQRAARRRRLAGLDAGGTG